MNIKTLFVTLLIVGLTACSHKTVVEVIDFQQALIDEKAVLIDNYKKEVSCIELQTDSNCMIATIEKIVKSTDHFFILDSESILFMFTDNGTFIQKIGKKGKGPNEYSYISDFCVDETNKLIYLNIKNSIKVFDFAGKFIREIDKHDADQFLFFKQNLIFSMPDRPVDTHERDAVLITDTSGKIIQSYKTSFVRSSGFEFPFSLLFQANDYCYYKEELADTLYAIDKYFKKRPISVLKLGKYKMPKEDYDFNKMKKWDQYYRFVDVYKLNPITIYKVQNGPVGKIDYVFRDNKTKNINKIINKEELAFFLDQKRSIPIIPISSYNNHLICSVFPSNADALANYLKTKFVRQNSKVLENNNPILLDIEF